MWCSFFFFFKKKTAYEMRISDWSSDVCSSDLVLAARKIDRAGIDADQFTRAVADESVGERRFDRRRRCGETRDIVVGAAVDIIRAQIEIGSAARLDVEDRLEAVPLPRVVTGIAAGNPIYVHGLPAHDIDARAVGGRGRRAA